MISDNELRLGNLIMDKNGRETLVRSLPLHFGRLYPIPITEEWLLKFGFEFFDSGLYRKGDFYLPIKFNDYTVLKWKVFEIAPVKYIHQLQNLFFAITGEELTIKSNAEVHPQTL